MERLSALYAQALFEFALERDAFGEFLDQAVFLRDALMDEDCLRMIKHPHIPASEKHELYRSLFSGHINNELLGFLFLVTDKNREAYLLSALEALIALIERHQGKVTANVSFATELSDGQISEMKQALSGRLGKTVEIALKVDPSIIGGPYIFVDGYYLDWTVKTRLREMTSSMKELKHS